ncbi:LacI family DNA-binding transcriptional regulator [Actinoallomurus sp. CA-150999]|uniref:LacI family DNA-binding transcriptional regulator n=1 Tax=Actinoallomurus sp. CA-150999 TaxID=3239887 RepID=UPI003D924D7E
MSNRRPTIADVAAHAGVSVGAVSFALNGRPGVGEETRQRILDTARELGWQPSHGARSLSTSRAFALGLVLARAPESIGSDPFFPAFIGGVEAVLAPRGQSLVLQVVPDAEAEIAGYRRLGGEGRVDGVFLTDLRCSDPRLSLLTEIGLPAVTLNRPDIESGFPAICLDDRPGIATAVGHLVGLGHTRIAHVAGPTELLHGRGRHEAWTAALDEAGLAPGPVVESDFTAAGGAAATRELLDLAERPTAIVYANDLMAVAGMAVAHERGYVVPNDLSITGFDDMELSAHVHPALTTVRTDPFGWGRAAARVLLDLVEGRDPGDEDVAPGALVIRYSTGSAPG